MAAIGGFRNSSGTHYYPSQPTHRLYSGYESTKHNEYGNKSGTSGVVIFGRGAHYDSLHGRHRGTWEQR